MKPVTCLPGQGRCSACTHLLGLVDKLTSQFQYGACSTRWQCMLVCAIMKSACALPTKFKLRIKKQMPGSVASISPGSADQCILGNMFLGSVTQSTNAFCAHPQKFAFAWYQSCITEHCSFSKTDNGYTYRDCIHSQGLYTSLTSTSITAYRRAAGLCSMSSVSDLSLDQK